MDNDLLNQAIKLAKESVQAGGFPAGAIVVKNGKIIGRGTSVGNIIHDPTAHGETAAIRNACSNLKISDLSGSILYASMEPCAMCLCAAMWSSISKIIYACSSNHVSNEYYGGAYDESEINKTFNRPIDIKQIVELEAASLKIIREWEKKLCYNTRHELYWLKAWNGKAGPL